MVRVNMKKLFKNVLMILIICVLTFPLFSCGEVNYDKSEYTLKYEIGTDKFKILQLTDIQIGSNDELTQTLSNVNAIITKSNPDYIVLTGDQFQSGEISKSSQYTIITSIFNCINSYNLPWSFVFGNHDDEGMHSKYEIVNIAKDYSNCLFLSGSADTYGNGNYVVNLTNDNITRYSLIMLDSNKYRTYFPFYSGYDYIHDNQIRWYEHVIKEIATEKYGDYNIESGHVCPSILFFHIPIPEFQTAYNLYENGEISGIGKNEESVCCPNQNTGLFDKVLELKSTTGIFVGHDHVNHSLLLYENIYLGYGVKSSQNSYYNENVIGGFEITINTDNSLSFNQLFI